MSHLEEALKFQVSIKKKSRLLADGWPVNTFFLFVENTRKYILTHFSGNNFSYYKRTLEFDHGYDSHSLTYRFRDFKLGRPTRITPVEY